MPAIKDKVVVITGSTRGFGYAIAEVNAGSRSNCRDHGQKPKAVESTLTNLQPKGRVSGFVVDVRKKNKSTSWWMMSSRNLVALISGSTTQAIPTRRA